jgi:hypothetical protein
MIVGGKYELAGVVEENAEFRTFTAREIPSGRTVLVHQILEPRSGSHPRSLRDLVERYGPVNDTCSDGGVDYAVTASQPRSSADDRFTRVGAWHVPASLSGPPAPPEPPPPPAEAPGEFTQMFRPVASDTHERPAAVPEPPPPPEASPPPEPGEFTRMFQAPAPSATSSPAPGPSPAASQPGGFTQMFQAPASSPPPAPLPPASPAQQGEFTRYFQSSLGSGSFEEKGSRAPTPTPAAPPPRAAPPPGEYTRLFQMPAPSAAPASPGRGATHVFVAPSIASPQPPVNVQEGPSEFTRMIQASPQPPAEIRPQPAPPPAAPKPAVPVVLIVLFAVLAVLAVALVLYFALRH